VKFASFLVEEETLKFSSATKNAKRKEGQGEEGDSHPCCHEAEGEEVVTPVFEERPKNFGIG
jgi:hypothetical protein